MDVDGANGMQPVAGRRRSAASQAARVLLCLTACLVCTAVGGAPGPPAGGPASAAPVVLPGIGAPHPVTGRLVTDAKAVAAGGAFRVGVLLTMQPNWHVYWKHPGDAGLATAVVFDLPAGFEAGPLQWPTPLAFTAEGEISSYGYSRQILLWAPVRAPRDLVPGGKVRIGASVSWLACRQVCLPGEGKYSIQLPTAADAAPDVAGAEVFGRWRRRLPTRVADSDAVVAADVAGSIDRGTGAGAFQITIDWRAGASVTDVQWFPAVIGGMEIADARITPGDGKARITFTARRLAGLKLARPEMESIVAFRDADGTRRAVIVPVALSSETQKPEDTKE